MIENNQKVLVIGSGGREHAIVWKLSQSDKVSTIYCLPGNIGMLNLEKAHCVTHINANDFGAIKLFATFNQISLIVVGPEAPLANGIADELSGFHVFGPSKIGALIESNKDWAKAFMIRHNIPTASYKSFDNAELAKNFIKSKSFGGHVIKASGLAAGKGVIVATDENVACEAVDTILVQKKFGSSGETVVIEEKLIGEEVSVSNKKIYLKILKNENVIKC